MSSVCLQMNCADDIVKAIQMVQFRKAARQYENEFKIEIISMSGLGIKLCNAQAETWKFFHICKLSSNKPSPNSCH